MMDELEHIRYVYHYTSLETLFAILESYRKDDKKQGLSFRATNIFKVNDPSEMKAGYDIIKKFLPKYEIDRGIPENQRLSEVYEDENYERKCKKDYYESIKGNSIEIGSVPYIICFSAKRDYLPMWTLYGKKGHGICLKIDTIDIINHMCHMPDETQIGFVSYDIKSGFRTLNEVLPWQYNLYLRHHQVPTIEDKITELSFLCFALSPFMKYKDYKYENELRIVHCKHYGQNNFEIPISKYMFAHSKHEVERTIDYPIPVSSLKEIILGPCLSENALRTVIYRELAACKLKVRITKSKIPFV